FAVAYAAGRTVGNRVIEECDGANRWQAVATRREEHGQAGLLRRRRWPVSPGEQGGHEILDLQVLVPRWPAARNGARPVTHNWARRSPRAGAHLPAAAPR